MSPRVRVELGERSYDVAIDAGSLGNLGKLAAALPKVRQAVVVSDDRVAELYAPAAIDSLAQAGLAASLLVFPNGEANKNLATLGRLYDELFAIEPAIDRQTLIVALGGGVVGDVAGLLAATALRGLRFVQCPTTLLADVDSSVGGKTGIDHPAGKNLIGAFHQPAGVLVDVETLRTLPPGELQSGLAECVKHAIIRDESLLDFIDTNADLILSMRARTMVELVARNVAIKAAVVSADEREAGQRAHLNFGHTIGHALEALGGYGSMSHGQAVALGMVAACVVAERRGMCEATLRGRLAHTLGRLGLAVTLPAPDADAVWAIMQHDKKTTGGEVRMILPLGCGQVEVKPVRRAELAPALEAISE
jgi:3-dehydroquinate synthase